MIATQQQQKQTATATYNDEHNITNATATTTTTTTTIATKQLKMERRESTTSESSVEQLDLGRTPKKLNTHSASTSTPHQHHHHHHHLPTHVASTNGNQIATATTTATTRKRKLRHTRDDTDDDDDDDVDEDEHYQDDEHDAAAAAAEEMEDSFADVQQQKATVGRIHKRLLNHHHNNNNNNTRRSSISNGATTVQLVADEAGGNSLRKKFRFNRSNSSSGGLAAAGLQQLQHSSSNNESGFVDASGNGSQYLLNATVTNLNVSSSSGSAASSAGSSPHNAVSSPESSSLAAAAVAAAAAAAVVVNAGDEHMKYVCPICEVVSATPHEFTNHIRCHNYASGDTENFTCKICSKVLSSASSLDRHVLVHTGERPFNCKYCHLTFTTNGNMHRHMRTHKQHQQNHHQRRNSNGTTKNNNNHSNNNNNSNNSSNSNSSSNGSNEGVKQAIAGAWSTTTTTTTAAAAAANDVVGVSKRRLNGCTINSNAVAAAAAVVAAGAGANAAGSGSGNGESYESDGSCSTDSTSANSQSSNNNNNNNNNNSHQHNNNNNNNNTNNNNLKANNNLKRKKSDQQQQHDLLSDVKAKNNNNNKNKTATTEIEIAYATNAHFNAVDHDEHVADVDDQQQQQQLVLMKQRRVKTTINNNNVDTAEIVTDTDAADIITSTPDVATVAAGAEPETNSDDMDDETTETYHRRRQQRRHREQREQCDHDDASKINMNTFTCPVCNDIVDFETLRDLSKHMDTAHAEIPAKCRDCDVVFRTHRQLNIHPCTQKLKTAVAMAAAAAAAAATDLTRRQRRQQKQKQQQQQQQNSDHDDEDVDDNNDDDDYAEDDAAEKAIVAADNENVAAVAQTNRNTATNKYAEYDDDDYDNDDDDEDAADADDVAEEEEDERIASADLQRRDQIIAQLYLKSKAAAEAAAAAAASNNVAAAAAAAVGMLSPIYNNEPEYDALICKYEAADTKHSHDSKDLADIQSILNMTSSSSTSNFLKNFEQSVNTPSSNYSLDKDEEEAQDAFTSEFRKMKMLGEFPCKLCTKVFPNLRALKGHNRIHLSAVGPAGPFRCNMCPYSICDKAALVRHMRTHNGDRPYECAVCNYAFTTKANCERHLRNRHAKTTRDEVKRAIIYHPSEDSSCDDPVKKLHLFATGSSDFDDELELSGYQSQQQQQQHHVAQMQPKDRSTPVSHLKEMLLSENHTPTSKPMKIQVKSLEQLLDKSNVYNESSCNQSATSGSVSGGDTAPIDLSMDVLDLSKKPNGGCEPKLHASQSEAAHNSTASLLDAAQPDIAATLADPKFELDKNQQFLLAQQQQLFNDAFPKALVDPTQYIQQLYRNLAMFQPLNPFFMQNTFMPGQLNELQKYAPLMNRLFGAGAGGAAAAAAAGMPTAGMPTMPGMNAELNKQRNSTPSPATTALLPQISPLMSDKSSSTPSMSSVSPSSIAQLLPKSLTSPVSSNALNIPRHPHMSPTVLPGGPVKMVIKNGVLMPKQKQRRYRTERPFACEHCSARFTLRSNMERHVKQQHPQFYAQRQRSGHHVMRGRGASSAAAMNSFNHMHAYAQAAQAQQQQQQQQHQHNTLHAQSHSNGGGVGVAGNNTVGGMSASPISDQVKYAILAQQLKARKDTDLLQQALAHGSSSVAPNHLLLGAGNTAALQTNQSTHAHFNFAQMNGNANALAAAASAANTAAMEDDEPKLIIDEDEDDEIEPLDDDVDEYAEEHEEEIDDDVDGDDDDDEVIMEVDNEMPQTLPMQHKEKELKQSIVLAPMALPKPIDAVKAKSQTTATETTKTAKKAAETILEQAIKSGSQTVTKAQAQSKAENTNNTAATAQPAAPAAMKSMIAQAESVGKFLKEVASSPFKDESQDLVSVSKLVDNATSNQMTFNNYFRPSDVANHMEQSDEEGLVASGSASESNNSGTEDVTAPAEPKKKSAYSLAPNRVSCPYCQRMFPWSSSLRRHILTHTGQKPFKCSHCPLLFTTKSNCDRHLLRKHGNVESAMSVYVPTEDVTEPIPVPKSVEEIEQQQRQREEEERRRKAEEAQLERERRELEKRRKQEQQRELLLKQMSAQFSLNQLNAAAAAAAMAANNNLPTTTATTTTALATTTATTTNATKTVDAAAAAAAAAAAGDLPFKCHLCESSFGERTQCLAHIKEQHAQEYTLLLAKGALETDVEPQMLHAANAAAAALVTIDEDDVVAAPATGNGKPSGKYPDYSNRKVICAFCVRRFWSTEDLRRHMRTHSGERPFQCEICQRKFTLKHSMLRHMKKHNGRQYNGANGCLVGDHAGAGVNSGSDFSDDEQLTNTPAATPPPAAAQATTLLAPPTKQQQQQQTASGSSHNNNNNNNNHIKNFAAVMHAPKIQELLSKANEWHASRLSSSLGEHKENIAAVDAVAAAAEQHNTPTSSDLIGNLLGISDQGILNKLLSSADEAAKLLGVEK